MSIQYRLVRWLSDYAWKRHVKHSTDAESALKSWHMLEELLDDMEPQP